MWADELMKKWLTLKAKVDRPQTDSVVVNTLAKDSTQLLAILLVYVSELADVFVLSTFPCVHSCCVKTLSGEAVFLTKFPAHSAKINWAGQEDKTQFDSKMWAVKREMSSLLCCSQLVWQECEGLGRQLQSMHQHLLRPPRPGDTNIILSLFTERVCNQIQSEKVCPL